MLYCSIQPWNKCQNNQTRVRQWISGFQFFSSLKALRWNIRTLQQMRDKLRGNDTFKCLIKGLGRHDLPEQLKCTWAFTRFWNSTGQIEIILRKDILSFGVLKMLVVQNFPSGVQRSGGCEACDSHRVLRHLYLVYFYILLRFIKGSEME